MSFSCVFSRISVPHMLVFAGVSLCFAGAEPGFVGSDPHLGYQFRADEVEDG